MNRQEQKLQTRKKILDAAERVFAKQGFAVSTTEVAKEAGVAHGSVFVHFPTKEALLEALIAEFFEHMMQQLDLRIRQSADIRGMLEIHLAVLTEKEAFYKALVEQGRLLPETARSCFAGFQSMAAWHFTEQAEAEIQEKRIRNIAPHMLFNTWIGLVHYYLLESDLFAPGESVLSRYREELIDTFMKLITA